MWFDNAMAENYPKTNEMHYFMEGVERFLGFVLLGSPDAFQFLWNGDAELQGLAKRTFEVDVKKSIEKVHKSIEKISDETLESHGLIGLPMRFKLKVLDSIARTWDAVKGQFTVRTWLKQMFDAIDVILDSMIQACGTGGLIKEFKDALSALVKTT
jgi:hypothetical protein